MDHHNQTTNNSAAKTLLVSGSNRGIGLSIVKKFLNNANFNVILTGRSATACEAILANLRIEQVPAANLHFCELDIANKQSILNCAEYVKKTFGKIDVLFNNAATTGGENEIALKFIEQQKKAAESKLNDGNFFQAVGANTKNESASVQQETLELFDTIFATNIYGNKNIIDEFLSQDLIKQNGKIITIASSTGNATRLESQALKAEILNENLSMEQFLEICARYRRAIENKTIIAEGWIQFMVPVYSNSKLLTNVYSRVLSKQALIVERGIQVYSMCPGWVATAMGGEYGKRTPDEGAVTPAYLINLEFKVNPDFQGKFFYNSKPYDWMNTSPPEFTKDEI